MNTLNLAGVQIHCDNMISPGNRQHIGHQFGTDWRTTLKLSINNCCLIIDFYYTLSFLSCLAYGKHGITAVTRAAEAILHAFIIISNSIRLSLTSPQPD